MLSPLNSIYVVWKDPNSGILEFWDSGILEIGVTCRCQSDAPITPVIELVAEEARRDVKYLLGVVSCICNLRRSEFWNSGILEFCSSGIPDFCKSRITCRCQSAASISPIDALFSEEARREVKYLVGAG